ncbi:MAG: class I SAM-dependent methyltransferase [Terriglobales bacterium]
MAIPGAPDPAALQCFEREFRERELDFGGDRRVRFERRVETEAVVRRVRGAAGLRVLDAGSGIGRVSHALLRRRAQVTALDFAHARLQQLRRQAPARGRLALAQADLTRLPLAPRSFDTIVCTQVIEHLPTTAARSKLLSDFCRLLRPGGRLLLTAYNYSQPWQRRGDAVEGRHPTGIFYHCYRAPELRAELEAVGFELLELCGLLHLWPHSYRLLPRLGGLGRALDHAGELMPAQGARWGHLLLAHAGVQPARLQLHR